MATTAVANKRRQEMRNTGCSLCGYNGIALQWDHVDTNLKSQWLKDNPSKSVVRMPEYRYRDEIKNCRVLCANCHGEHTYQQQMSKLTISEGER